MRGRPTQLKPSERLCGDFDYVTQRNELIPQAKAEANRKHPATNLWNASPEWATCYHATMNRLAFEEGLTTWK